MVLVLVTTGRNGEDSNGKSEDAHSICAWLWLVLPTRLLTSQGLAACRTEDMQHLVRELDGNAGLPRSGARREVPTLAIRHSHPECSVERRITPGALNQRFSGGKFPGGVQESISPKAPLRLLPHKSAGKKCELGVGKTCFGGSVPPVSCVSFSSASSLLSSSVLKFKAGMIPVSTFLTIAVKMKYDAHARHGDLAGR